MSELTPQERAIIKEEESRLAKLQGLSRSQSYAGNREALLRQILELRESLNDANEDDLPHLTEQINHLMNLVNQSDQADAVGFNPKNPYFARLILEEENRKLDLYIGTQVFSERAAGLQIVDWKASPIASLYFRYQQGEEYEEEIGGRTAEGEIKLKRHLKVEEGELVLIEEEGLALHKEPDGTWGRGRAAHFRLGGGSGQASRAERAVTEGRGHRLLPEITALIDPAQFELITQPDSGILAIQGTAGSGKTTVALHRAAWLHQKDPKKFAPEKIMVMVFNRALARYIGLLLPSLGTDGVNIEHFDHWAGEHRQKLYSGLFPKGHSQETPVAVIRLKKHPRLLKLIEDFANNKKANLDQTLAELVKAKSLGTLIPNALASLSFVDQITALRDWVRGQGRLGGQTFAYSGEVKALLSELLEQQSLELEGNKKQITLELYDEFFSDFEGLRQAFSGLEELGPERLEEAINWIKRGWVARQEGSITEEDAEPDTLLDYEDDPILLYFWVLFAGPIEKQKYAHLLIDEAQDLSLVEHKLLLSLAKDPKCVTYAGDHHQQMIQYNNFQSWDWLFDQLGLPGQKISNLKVSYRATQEIMEFAMGILGKLAEDVTIRAIKNGPAVELHRFAHQGELARALAENLKDLVLNERNASVALITLNQKKAKEYYDILYQMEIPGLRLIDDQNFSFTAGIDITDVTQVKGLEFDYVVLLDVDAVDYPENSYHQYLLHIGATRAAYQLWLMSYKEPSLLLPASMR